MAAIATRLLVLLLFGFFGTEADAQQSMEAKDMLLENSGFVIRPALTPQQLDRVRLLPPGQFIARSKNGQRYFLYADPDLCKCVFVGTELAMANYQNLMSSPSMSSSALPSGQSAIPQGGTLYQDMDPNLANSIPDGDILDSQQ
jgi:hypothetical protein